MQSRRLRICGAVAYMTAMITWSAVAAEPSEPSAGAIALSADAVSEPQDVVELYAEPPVPIGADVEVQRIVVTTTPEGETVVQEGAVSAGTLSCLDDPNAVYCNTAGWFLHGNSGGSATAIMGDDIVTTGGAGRLLDRFVIRVTGDRYQDGTGTALGGYTVNYALYETCPGANVAPVKIPGTQGSLIVPQEQAGMITEVEHHVVSGVPLQASQFYLGIAFSRTRCASVVGAPALKGYSADQLDIPGAACDAWLGGFPGQPHASVYAEVYVQSQSPDSFIGYRNAAQAELSPSENERVRMADNFIVPRDCNLVGYEVAFHPAVVEVDLRPGPNIGGRDGPFFPGTRKQFNACFGCDVQVGHVDVNPPIQLFAGQQHWVTFLSGSSGVGPILTCREPRIGETANQYLAYSQAAGEWQPRLGSDSCWYGFDVTLFCEGPPPPGACCDMALRECVGGDNDGQPCNNNVPCIPGGGSCESVCREVPEQNCTGSALGAPLLWRENGTCGPVCTGGGAEGEHCAIDDECNVCVGGPRDSEQCCPDGDCTDVCAARSETSCSTDTDCRVCVGGELDGFPCPSGNDIDCSGGTCDTTDTCVSRCSGGSRDGQECCPFGECPAGACEGARCLGGINSGDPCTREADCPGGTCDGGPFTRACGLSACCKPNGSFCVGGVRDGEACQDDVDCGACQGGVRDGLPCGILGCSGGVCNTNNSDCVPLSQQGGICENLTRNECNAVPPQALPRQFQIGLFCGTQGQSCPLTACLTRDGACTTPRQSFCRGGQNDGEACNLLAVPGICATNFDEGNLCGGNCLGGDRDGDVCDPNGFFIAECDGGICPGGGTCIPARCVGRPGCSDPFCCTAICNQANNFYCCSTHWDQFCANAALANPQCRQGPPNDECFDPDPFKGAELLSVPDTVDGDSISATPEVAPGPGSGLDPGFCCHEQNAGAGGVGNLWYKFIATGTSARISTCNSDPRIRDGISYRAEDSLIAVYSVNNPRRGLCADQATVCDVINQDCPDGSQCVFDEETACESLTPVACNDDNQNGCGLSTRASVCATGLIPGNPYYVQVAGKTNTPNTGDPATIVRGNGVWKINISSPCSLSRLTMANDPCTEGYVLQGGDVSELRVPFDLTGNTVGQCNGASDSGDLCLVGQGGCPEGNCVQQAAATFDCPGPPISCDFGSIRNDIWYTWTAPINGEATFSTCGDQGDLDTPDTGLVVYDCCDCPADDRCIAECSWFTPSPCLGGSLINMPVEQGTCYQLRLGGNFGDEPAGDLKISVDSFCGNGRIDPEDFLNDPKRCVGGDNDSLICTTDADCPGGGICGEECDGGTGCGPDCQCMDGWNPTLIPSRNCEEKTAVSLMGSKPECDVSLTRPSNNVIRLTFSGSLPATPLAGEVEIVEITDGGVAGADMSASVSMSVVGGNVLEIRENGTPVLENEKWYAIRNLGTWSGVANFEVDYRAVFGDANNSGFTNFADLATINSGFVDPAADNDLNDINASGFVNFADLAAAFSFNGTEAQDPKPTGHGCFAD